MDTRWLFVLLLVSTGFAQTPQQFMANVDIHNDPNVPNGLLQGVMRYDKTNELLRVDYALDPIEVFVFKEAMRYLYCPEACDTQTWKEAMPQLYHDPRDTSAGVSFQSCPGWTTVQGSPVQTIFTNPTTGLPCRAIFTNGKIIDFSNWQPLNTNDMNIYLSPDWLAKCPQKQCNMVMDLVLVFDESGSIDDASFRLEKQFAADIVNSFDVSPTAVNVGLVMFSDGARTIIPILNNKDSVLNSISKVTQRRGYTCIGCAIHEAVKLMNAHDRGAARVMIILTDGKNNRPFDDAIRDRDHLDGACQAADAIDAKRFAIGVASVDTEEIDFMSTKIAGVNTSFYSPDFKGLSGILNQLVSVTCLDMPPTLCGSSCLGFCSCEKVCLCPDVCPFVDHCTDNICIDGQNGNGCFLTDVDCSDDVPCTIDTCDPASGCEHVNRDCEDGDPCTINECDPPSGICFKVDVLCDDGNACTNDWCDADPPVGCKHTPVDCDDGYTCTQDLCNNHTGCYHPPLDCSDSSLCTEDRCVEPTGCVNQDLCVDDLYCTIDKCQPDVGCIFEPVNCDNGDPCTADVCVERPGDPCDHTPVWCDQCEGKPPCPPVKCKDVSCDPDTGACVDVDRVCFSPNLCTIAFCDVNVGANGTCVLTPKVCAAPNCKVGECDMSDGQCYESDKDCNDFNPCTDDSCDPNTGLCVNTPKVCPDHKCQTGACNIATGDCEYADVICPKSPCWIDSCDPNLGANGECVKAYVDCSALVDACHHAWCDDIWGCQNRSFDLGPGGDCDDNDLCTDDACDPSVGCVYAPHQCIVDNCHLPDCSPIEGCLNTPIECKPEMYGVTQDCYWAECIANKTPPCQLNLIPGSVIDVCGVCNGDSSFCRGGMTTPEQVAIGISAGVVAAIIIAGVVFLIIAAVGSGITYNQIMKARHANLEAAHENPMYQASDKESFNPAYQGNG